jgi:hypothetical protein
MDGRRTLSHTSTPRLTHLFHTLFLQPNTNNNSNKFEKCRKEQAAFEEKLPATK